MQHTIQDWKEKKRGEFLKKVEKSDFSYDDWNKEISDWWLSQLPSLLTLLEEEMNPKRREVSIPESAVAQMRIPENIGYNIAREEDLRLLAETKQQLG